MLKKIVEFIRYAGCVVVKTANDGPLSDHPACVLFGALEPKLFHVPAVPVGCQMEHVSVSISGLKLVFGNVVDGSQQRFHHPLEELGRTAYVGKTNVDHIELGVFAGHSEAGFSKPTP